MIPVLRVTRLALLLLLSYYFLPDTHDARAPVIQTVRSLGLQHGRSNDDDTGGTLFRVLSVTQTRVLAQNKRRVGRRLALLAYFAAIPIQVQYCT